MKTKGKKHLEKRKKRQREEKEKKGRRERRKEKREGKALGLKIRSNNQTRKSGNRLEKSMSG